MSKTVTKNGSATKQSHALIHPSLLRGEARLRYVQRFQGTITPKRAKVLLKELARARASWDRPVTRKRRS